VTSPPPDASQGSDAAGADDGRPLRSPAGQRALEWNERGLTLGGTPFRVGYEPGIKTDAMELLLFKPRWMVERYAALIDEVKPERMLELGIFHGGSVAFLALLAKPTVHVAIDRQPQASARFDDWCQAHRDVVHPYYGVDQGDAAALRRIVADEFGDDPLDLVIDDASHLLDPTRTSFNVLFPLLRPGGVYVIEDWGVDLEFERKASQDPVLADRIQEEITKRPELEHVVPLTRLVFEIVLASVYTDLIEEMELRPPNWLTVTRGAGTANDEYDLRRCSLSMGQRLLSDNAGVHP
jgi:predicted O-methyltransferase YrrM